MHEDIVFSTQTLFKTRKAVHLKEGLYHYDRTNASSATRSSNVLRRGNSCRNMLDMLLHFRDRHPSPVDGVEDEILLRAAWVGFTLDRRLFGEYPFLLAEASAVPVKRGRFVRIPQQLVLKLFLNRKLAEQNR